MLNKILLTLLTINCSLLTVHAQWVQVLNGMGNVTVVSLAYSGNNLFAGTVGNGGGNGVYLSTNNGTNWTQTSLNNQGVWSLAANGNNIFAGTGNPGSGVFVSIDNGTTWTQTSLNNNGNVLSLAVNGNNVFASTNGYYGVYRSTNNGTTWDTTSVNNQTRVYSLAYSGNNIFAGTQWNGVYLSTNNGASWTQTSLNNQGILSLAVNGNNIFAGTYVYPNGTGVYVSTNNGTSWIPRNEGLGNLWVSTLCILNNYIFAGAGDFDQGGVWRRPLGELVGINPVSNEVPEQFSLSQNYPNPFNPTTKIRFALPKNSFAKIVVYDMLGRELETLVSEQLNAGTYEADWNGTNYPSGVYYYKLSIRQAGSSTGEFSETRKAVLIK